MWFMVLVRLVMLVAMPNMRHNRKMKEYSVKYWAPFYVIYAIVFSIAGTNVSDLSYSMLVVDGVMFVF